MSPPATEITVLGAGLTGPLLSLYLARQGYRVTLYEKRPDLRRIHLSAGKSINLAISARGLHALAEVGLLPAIEKVMLPMQGRHMHDKQGGQTFQPYGQAPHECIHSISRGHLNHVLLDAAEATGLVHIQFETVGHHFDLTRNILTLKHEQTGAEHRVTAPVILGTDGSASLLRHTLMQQTGYQQQEDLLDYGYKELTIPPTASGDFALNPQALHIWPRSTYMLIALPNPDRSFTGTLFLPHQGEPGFEQLITPEQVTSFFAEQFSDTLPLIPHLSDDFLNHPTGVLGTVRCYPWSWQGQLLLLGDAAHAIVPFFGQGMNCAFEDCSVLNQLMPQYDTWESLFKAFETNRKPDTDAIATLALDNFVEMRDKVGEPHFLLQKKVSLMLEARYPQHFIPKYSMVSFHRTPYREALRQGQIQDAILAQLCQGLTASEQLDWALAEQLLGIG